MKKIKIKSEVLDTVILSAVNDITNIIEVKGQKLRKGEGISRVIRTTSNANSQPTYRIIIERV